MAEEDKYEVRAMNEEQAKAWFVLGDETLNKLEPRDIANLQLAMEKNPEAFTDAQRAKVKDISWNKIESVAKGKRKLDPKETNSFRSMLDRVPASTFMETGKDLSTFKEAENKWYRADRGIEEKSFGERVREQAQGAKKHVSQKVAELKSKGKAIHRLNRMRYNRDKAAIKQLFTAAKAKAVEFKNKVASAAKQGVKTAAEVPFVLAYGVKELAAMGYNAAKNKINQGVNKVKNGIKRRVNNVKNKINNGVNKVKNFGKKVWNGTKKVAKVTGYIIASPVIVPYKAARWMYRKVKAGINWVRNGYKALKARAFGGPSKVSQDAKTAEKQARGNQNKLSAEQVIANWKQIGRGESDGRYNMSRHSESVLDAAMKGEIKIDKSNAAQMAAWLEVNRDIQDRINHNNVVEKNERNKAIAAQLEQFGYENPYKTKETQEQEAQTQTPPVQDKPKEQDISQRPNSEQANTQKPAENTAQVPNPKDVNTFNLSGITGNEGVSGTEQTQAQTQTPPAQNRSNEPQAQTQTPPAQDRPNEPQAQTQTPPVQNRPNEPQAQTQTPPAQDRPNEPQAQTQTPPVQNRSNEPQAQMQTPPVQNKPREQAAPALTDNQSQFVQTQLGILQQLGKENNLKPNDELYKGLVGMMEKGFAEEGISPAQMEEIRKQNQGLFPSQEQKAQNSAENTQQPAKEGQKAAEKGAKGKERALMEALAASGHPIKMHKSKRKGVMPKIKNPHMRISKGNTQGEQPSKIIQMQIAKKGMSNVG